MCGPEKVLRDELHAAYVEAVPVLRSVMWAGEPADAVWDLLLSCPVSTELRLVFGAEKLPRRERIPLLLEDEFDGAFTVFFSAENDFPRAAASVGADGKPHPVLSPAMAALRDSRHGQLVRCCAPSKEEDKAEIVARWWPGAGRNLASELLTRCGGDLSAAREAARKAEYTGLAPVTASLALVVPEPAGGEYTGFVVAGKRKDAMSAAALLGPDEAGAVLGLLSSRLGTLALLGDAVRKNENVALVARRLGIDPYWAQQARPYCAAYTADRTAKCRQALALAESAWRSGARTGILEAVAALWPV